MIRRMWSAEAVLACALALLNRNAASFPPVELVAVRPGFVSPAAEGYVVDGVARIYIVTTANVFLEARHSVYPCGNLSPIRKIASVLIHEEWHLQHGRDEAGAYLAQLTALVSMGAGPGTPIYGEVRRSMAAALRARPK